MRVSPGSSPRPAVITTLAALVLLVVACQGSGSDRADEAASPDGAQLEETDGDPSAPSDDGDPSAPSDDGDPSAPSDDGDPSAPSDDGDTTPPDRGEDEPGSDEVLGFTARSLEGGEVDVAETTDGPVLLWMWAPW